MKRLQMTIVAIFLSLTFAAHGNAGDNAVGGLLIGAGSGALIGSATGKNTESVLIGTAIGGAVGYAIGNSMERPSHAVYHSDYRQPSEFRYHDYRPHAYYPPKPVHHYSRPYSFHRDYGRHHSDCRETIIYKKERGRVSKIVKSSCNTPRYYAPHHDRTRWHR